MPSSAFIIPRERKISNVEEPEINKRLQEKFLSRSFEIPNKFRPEGGNEMSRIQHGNG
jgi:hypothetical protein